MTPKNKNNTAVATTKPATATTPAQVSTNPTTNANDKPKVEGILFAKPKAEKAKSDRPYCGHTNGKGERCQLRVMEGRERCVNHVPAEERLTAEEAQALLALVGGLDEAQQIRLITRAVGWYKVKQLVSGKPEGDVVLNELVG